MFSSFALRLLPGGFGVAFLLAFAFFLTGSAAAISPSDDALVRRYCVGCHNDKLRVADVSLEDLDPRKPAGDVAVWEKVLRKVSAKQMPPAGMPRPDAAMLAAFTARLERRLDQAAVAHPNPGHPTIHRLNRSEYSNAVRDLLAIDMNPGSKLPIDDSGYGFDNIGDVLSLSPVLIERYVSTARVVARTAVASPGSDVPSRARIFVCVPADAAAELPCARQIIETLGRRAYRRPFTDADLNPLLTFFETGRAERDFDYGIEFALRAMLVSPDFLFRIEHDSASAVPGSAHRVNDYELASRLSFFLWSSIPDDQLLELAAQGKLREPIVLAKQVDRMLHGVKSRAFIDNFAGQWLLLRNLDQIRPDSELFPQFNKNVRQAFQEETREFFGAVLDNRRPVTELLDARYTFLNQRLAEFYGITGVEGPNFRRVELTDSRRGGLLGQASILTVTSYPNRTSVVQRGKWVLENLLGTPPPPPPPDVPALDLGENDKKLSVRQAMEAHRANAVCASCHSKMDPIGFALENYDAIGKWRDLDNGTPIDASGKLPDGSRVDGVEGLRRVLVSAHREEFIATFTEKLMTYALGRGIESYDRPVLRAVVRQAAKQGNTIPALIDAIVASAPFQMRAVTPSLPPAPIEDRKPKS